jgi:DNA processing protein
VSGAPVQTLGVLDPAFPWRLREARRRLGGLPEALDVRGALGDGSPAVAIVGARAAREADLGQARSLAAAVAADGGVVISGGALGVDAAAHGGALEAGGATWVVLGTGIDVVYPARHGELFDAVVARGGAVVSALPRGMTPRRGSFVARNALIAALADVVVVIGARGRSGALHTAEAAHALGRPVAAVPGADGCTALLAAGAARVESPADLAACLAGSPRRLAVELPGAGSDGHHLLAALSDHDPLDLEELISRTGLPLRAAQRALAELELRGLVLLAPGQAYVRSPLAAVTAYA